MSTSFLGSIIPNCIQRATFLSFFAAGFLLFAFGLLINERVAAIIVAFEIVRGSFAAEIAINALIVHVIFSAGVFGVFVRHVCHRIAGTIWGSTGAECKVNFGIWTLEFLPLVESGIWGAEHAFTYRFFQQGRALGAQDQDYRNPRPRNRICGNDRPTH